MGIPRFYSVSCPPGGFKTFVAYIAIAARTEISILKVKFGRPEDNTSKIILET